MLLKKNMNCTFNNKEKSKQQKLTKYVEHINPVHIVTN